MVARVVCLVLLLMGCVPLGPIESPESSLPPEESSSWYTDDTTPGLDASGEVFFSALMEARESVSGVLPDGLSGSRDVGLVLFLKRMKASSTPDGFELAFSGFRAGRDLK